MINRRTLLAGAASLAAAEPVLKAKAAFAAADSKGKPDQPSAGFSIYVPGYNPGLARSNGVPIADNAVRARNIGDFSKPYRLLTRITLAGDVTQALLPAWAHDVKISPDKSAGILCGFEKTDHAAFDPETLDLLAVAPAYKKGWRGGGHAAFPGSGTTVLTSERAPRRARRESRLKKQYGRISIRDAATLKMIGSYSSYGIDPHDMQLIEDDRYLVVANYGSLPRKGKKLRVPRDVSEACVCIIDMQNGKLLDKIITGRRHTEARHLAAGSLARIFLIQARLGKGRDGDRLMKAVDTAYQADITAERDLAYMSAATLKLEHGKPPITMGSADEVALMRHGLSIRYDPAHDQAIATYPSSHHLMVFDGASGRVTKIIDTVKHGLRYPCGITMLPGGRHYAVAGYWENIFVFERGTHRLIRGKCLYPTLFGHSHIWAA